MSQWIERINNHVVWGGLKSLGISIDLALAREGNDAAVIDGLERIRTVLAFCGKRLASTDPILIEPRPLVLLTNQLIAAKAELDAYVTDGIPAHITAANARADEILVVLPSVLAPIATEDLTIINESISTYRTTLEKYLQTALADQKKVGEASASNENRIKLLEVALNTEQQKLAALLLEQQSQFSSAQDRRASEFVSVLADQQSKYAMSASEQQTQFSADQDARKSSFATSQRDNQEKVTALIADYTQKLADQNKDFADKVAAAAKVHEADIAALQSSYEKTAEQILEHINKHKEEVEKLVGVIGNLGVTSGYQKVANLARRLLFVWQGLTVIALAGLIFVAFLMAFPQFAKSMFGAPDTSATIPTAESSGKAEPVTPPQAVRKAKLTTPPQATAPSPASDSVFYQGLATRIFLSLTFGIFAGYAARQASHFLEMERKNRKLALELEALGPYIAPLDKAKQDEFRLKIGDRSFGVLDEDSNKQKPADPVTATDLFSPKELGEFVASAVKGLK